MKDSYGTSLCWGRRKMRKTEKGKNYWQKTFLDVDFPLNKFQNDVLKDRISNFLFGISSGILLRGRMCPMATLNCQFSSKKLKYLLTTLLHPSLVYSQNYFPLDISYLPQFIFPTSNKFQMLFDNHGISLLCLQLILGKAKANKQAGIRTYARYENNTT